jgi:Calcineurin-like phosphoesterase superfamily domain
MRIGVISDTHGLLRPEAERALLGVELIIHAGDVGKPEILERLKKIAPVFAVRGNVDIQPWAQELPLRGHGVPIETLRAAHGKTRKKQNRAAVLAFTPPLSFPNAKPKTKPRLPAAGRRKPRRRNPDRESKRITPGQQRPQTSRCARVPKGRRIRKRSYQKSYRSFVRCAQPFQKQRYPGMRMTTGRAALKNCARPIATMMAALAIVVFLSSSGKMYIFG